MKKFIVFCLIAMLLFCAVGCDTGSDEGGKRPPEEVAADKTQLYVSNYDGGYGTEWLYAIKDRFEAEYAERSFETGKKGVQIMIHADKDGYIGSSLYDKMGVTTDEVFFSESITFNDYVSSGYMLDLSDVVTEVNSDGKTIESKMSTEQKNSLKIGGKYYCIPHYAAFTGINYDIDLFDAKKLYFAKNGAPSEAGYTGSAKYTNLAGERSAGPDGQYDTYDDGLPATYDEFFTLCAYMKNKGVTPLCWTGQYHTTYCSWILAALAADYEGKEQMMLNYDFNGTAKNLVTVSGSEIVPDADDTVIKNSNGYELYRSAGRYYALNFFNRVLDNNYNYYHTCGFDNGCSHINAQENYLRSSQKNDPIAMLLEGIWWENEAEDTFRKMANRYGEEWSMANRRFGIMPLPKASAEKIGEKSTLLDNNYSYCFINKKLENTPYKVELAKLFLKFCNTDTSLREFTTVVGLPKALDYDMGDNVKWKSAYSKNVWDLYANSDRVYPISQNPLYLSSQSTFVYYSTFVTGNKKSPIDAFYADKDLSAASYFADIIKLRNKKSWDSAFSRYFED